MAQLTAEQQQQVIDLLDQLSGPAPTTNAVGQSVQPTPNGDIPEGAVLLGTYPDNGCVDQKPDGSLGAVSAGGSTIDQDVIARIMEGMTPAQADAGGWQRSAIQENPGLARVATAVQGTPFVGGWADEFGGLFGGLNNETGDTTGRVANQSIDYLQQAMADQKPWESLGLQLGVGVGTSLPFLSPLAKYVAGGTGLLGQTLRAGVAAATGGGIEGLLSQAGNERGDGPEGENRLWNAIRGGGIGAGIGGIFGLASQPVMRGIKNLFSDGTQEAAGAATGVSPAATRFIQQVVGSEDPATAVANIAGAGRTGMLADAGPVTQNVLDALIQRPGAAGAVGRQRVGQRAATVMGDMTQGMDDALGKPQGLISIEDAIRTNARPDIQDAYNAAYATPIDYASPEGMAIEDVLNRAPVGTARTAIQRANERMRYFGAPQNQIMASIADDGTVSFQEMPNVMQLDYIKRAFDSIARDGTDKITRAMTDEASFAAQVARDIRNATRDAVPAYRTALELASDDITQREAVDFGSTILQNGTTREMVSRAVKDATKPELAAMRLALRSQIDETLANVRRISSAPMDDTSSRQLNEAFRMLNSDAAQTKIRSLLGDDADFLIQNINEAQQALGLKGAVNRGSQTFGRQAVDELLRDTIEPGVIGQAMQGRGINATQRFVQELTSMTPENMNARSQKLIAEITDVLTRSGNVDAMQSLKLLQAASMGTPVTEKQAYQIARAMASATGLAGHQLGTQSLVSPQRGLLAQ